LKIRGRWLAAFIAVGWACPVAAPFTQPALVDGDMVVNAGPAPAIVLARFVARQQAADGWGIETMQVDASLPGLKKEGRFRAIRRILPGGRRNYDVLEKSGDATVFKQVIARYVNADEEAADIPASSFAITPENYKIRYLGDLRLTTGIAYAFRIVPRKKAEGLINGVLWLDGGTAVAVRESGYLAKSPSIFLKRVYVTRENELHDGDVGAKITHVNVEARFVGRAELVVVERPASSSTSSQ
jgi:hypothetical protein